MSAWVTGASDPISGTVSVSEAIRGFGALMRKGWKPLRTILIASWDGEEVRRYSFRRCHAQVSFLAVWIDWQHRMGGGFLRVDQRSRRGLC